MINTILRSLGFFDLNGMKYSIAHLEAVRPHIGTMDVHSQAKYVDAVTKQMVDGNQPLSLIGFGDEIEQMTPAELHQANTTGIGNLAYVALHARSPKLRTTAENLLVDYRGWLVSKNEYA